MSAIWTIRLCNIGLVLGCAGITWSVSDYRNPMFHFAAVATGWFARTTIEEWS